MSPTRPALLAMGGKDMARPDGTGSTSLRSPEPEVSALSGDDPSRVHGWLRSMQKYGEDQVWRGADRAIGYVKKLEAENAYLRDSYHVAQTMLGLVSLNASPELMGKLRPYSEELGRLWINRLLDLGVPPSEIGQRKTFPAEDHLVAQAIEARRAATGTGAVHESAVPQGCAQPDDRTLADKKETDRA